MSIAFTIDGKQIPAEEKQTILAAALNSNIYIPHICYHPDLSSFQEVAPTSVCYRGKEKYSSGTSGDSYEGCGLCLVKVEGKDGFVLSCVTQVREGMNVLTRTDEIEARRRDALAAILDNHPHACLTCAQREGCSLTQCSTNVPENERCCPLFDVCELRKVADYVGIKEDVNRYVFRDLYIEKDDPLFIRDYNLCIGCLRCVRVCSDVIGADVFGFALIDGRAVVGTRSDSLETSACRFCGLCVEVCPTGALRDKELAAGNRREALVPCTANCPIGMDIPSYIRYIAEGDYDAAAALIRERTPFALSLGYICHHPCEDACRRGKLDDPIGICDLKRFALETSEFRDPSTRRPLTGKKVGIVGAGPAGLVAAYFLAKLGHDVTVFETHTEPGGMLRQALPDYRLPRNVVDQEIEYIKAAGVKILTNTPVNKETFLKDFEDSKWDAVFIAAGLPHSKKIDVEGSEMDGVYWGLEFLKDAKQGKKITMGEKTVVIGGGDVAIDVAMTALRLGAGSVSMACLEQRNEMPASDAQIREAEEEGIAVYNGWGPKTIVRNGSSVKGVELVHCTSVFDEKGSFNPAFDESKRTFLPAQTVILAVGQRSDLSFLPLELELQMTDQRTIKVKPDTLETSVTGIFAGGEAVSGPGSAVEAMAMGRQASASIDKYLGGDGSLDSLFARDHSQTLPAGIGAKAARDEGFRSRARLPMPSLQAPERLRTFDLIHLGYGKDEAYAEAFRCLGCNLRFLLSPVTLPPEKWLEISQETVDRVSETEGVFQLFNEKKEIILIAGTSNLRQSLQEQLSSNPESRYFDFEEDPLYTKRESELIQQHLQKYGRLPSGNEADDDLF